MSVRFTRNLQLVEDSTRRCLDPSGYVSSHRGHFTVGKGYLIKRLPRNHRFQLPQNRDAVDISSPIHDDVDNQHKLQRAVLTQE
jgi:hypothetical protein